MHSWDLEAVEADFAEAALDSLQWTKVLDRITSMTNSFGAVLLPLTGAVLPTVPFSDSMSASVETYVRDGWYLRDERHRGISIMKRRGIVDDLDIFSPEQIARHPYYQEFLAPHRLRWFAGVRISLGDDLWCLSIQRTIDQGPFSETERNRLAKLSKGLSGSAAIARALGASTAVGILEAFQISGTAVVLIDRQGRIFEVNECAQRLLVGGIRIVKGRLVTNSPEATATFEKAVHALLNRPEGGLSPPIAIPRKVNRPLLAYPAKVSRTTASALADCQAIVIFIDPGIGPHPDPVGLQSMFRLTAAEARLAVLLASGESLEMVAERLGIAKETSRSQLKSIFAKTGVHRQAELVALLARVL